MRPHPIRTLTGTLGVAVAGSLAAMAITAAPAAATTNGNGNSDSNGSKSLAEVLAADGQRFDRNGHDYDILDAAVAAVLKAKPGSPVKVLADGKVELTAFLPKDSAFKKLVRDTTGKRVYGEAKVFAAVAEAFGIDTIEKVLLYHVVPGKPINASAALKADGKDLKTALGSTIRVSVVHGKHHGHHGKHDAKHHGKHDEMHHGKHHGKHHGVITLKDKDPDLKDPAVRVPDINAGNRQIAHGIDRVLLPVNL